MTNSYRDTTVTLQYLDVIEDEVEVGFGIVLGLKLRVCHAHVQPEVQLVANCHTELVHVIPPLLGSPLRATHSTAQYSIVQSNPA